MMLSKPIAVLLLLCPVYLITAQTCCSGGVPLAGNLGLPAVAPGSWQIGLSYDHNRLRRLYTGDRAFAETSRTRTTHSALLEVGYAISERWQLDVLLPFIRQERLIEINGRRLDATAGLGDAVVLLRYNWLAKTEEPPWQWASGLGVKAPNGAADRQNPSGISYNADLQPGSGAWDLVLWNRFSHQPSWRPSMSVFFNSVYRFRGENDNYLPVVDPRTGQETPQSYRFGNELQLTLGVSDRVFLLGQLLDPGVSLLYRQAAADRTNDAITPSTGGSFFFLQPSLGIALSSRLNWQLAVDLPVYTKVTGTQVAPTLRFNTGFILLLPAKTFVL